MNKELFNRFSKDMKRYLTSLPKEKAMTLMNFVQRHDMDKKPPSFFAKRFEANPTPKELEARKAIVMKVLPLTDELKEKYKKAYHEKMKIPAKESHDYVLILPHGVVMPESWDTMVQRFSVTIPLFIIKHEFQWEYKDRGVQSIMNSYLPYKNQLR